MTSSSKELMVLKKKSTHAGLWMLAGFGVGILAVLLLLVEAKVPGFSIPDVDDNLAAATSTDSLPAASALVAVNDQSSGNVVMVARVAVEAPGVWVAVHELNGTKLGNVLGAARVREPGTNVAVPLLRATAPGKTYAIALYRDDNLGDFAYEKNSAYVDYDTGERVIAPFRTTQ